jgi:hypothetical protein
MTRALLCLLLCIGCSKHFPHTSVRAGTQLEVWVSGGPGGTPREIRLSAAELARLSLPDLATAEPHHACKHGVPDFAIRFFARHATAPFAEGFFEDAGDLVVRFEDSRWARLRGQAAFQDQIAALIDRQP